MVLQSRKNHAFQFMNFFSCLSFWCTMSLHSTGMGRGLGSCYKLPDDAYFPVPHYYRIDHFVSSFFHPNFGMTNVKCHEKFKRCIMKVQKSGKVGFTRDCPYDVAVPTMVQGMDMAIMFSQLGNSKLEL
ncbi:hypothetical protein MTR67_031265 [Solanum verrucosum]|uniref:Uncharacterized protein n=1 Tax=Solanum verrucosum TaxID=315347 RepID=A0AAF0ZFT7_SOLVR|nr:hypothetical protein MTR67_031265 [Solanum verrucosum]